MKKRAKKIFRASLYGLFLTATTVLVMELAYRYQWIDFYATEWRALNPAAQPANARKKMLVLGDSFSAQPFSYAQVLRDSLPGCAVFNAAVGGTGIREALAIARKRLRRLRPDVLVCQVYVGNDLWDMRKRVPGKASRLRRAYWWLSDRLLFLRYINYKSGQLKATAAGTATELKNEDLPFAPDTYSPREKMLFRADPRLIEHSALLSGGRAADMADWLASMDALIELLPSGDCQVVLVVVPHCAQVSAQWRERMPALGSAPVPTETGAAAYPFLQRIAEHYRHDRRVRVLSALPAFQAATEAGSRLFYENDPHLSVEGQHLLGRLVLEEIKRE